MNIFLETKRLILKPPSISDLEHLIKLRSDPDVMRYIGDGSTHTKSQVESFLKSVLIPYQEKYGFGFCSVFEKETGEFIGQAGLFHKGFWDEQPDIELAYRLHKKYWGKGYATELTKALIHWAFENLKLDKIVAASEPENIASQKVLLKSGFLFLGKQAWRDGKELFYYEIYKNDAIELSPYNKEWPEIAKREIQKLYEILPKKHLIDIQHVGSTAIPGMIAKPVIDIQITVDSLNTIKKTAINRLKEESYIYWAENPDPERLFFVKGMPPYGEKRTFHIHIVEPGSKKWREKILFRDHLRLHPEDARKYEQLKRELANEHTYDREEYTNAKSKFIQDILKKVGNTRKIIITINDPTITQLGVDAMVDFYQTISIDTMTLSGFKAFVTSVDSSSLNVVLDNNRESEVNLDVLQKIEKFFKKYHVPWGWFSTALAKTDIIEQYGFELIDQTPGMYFNLSDELPSVNDISLEIKEGDIDLKEWIQPIREGFPSTDDCETYRKLNATLQHNGEQKLCHFTAYYDQEPASSGTLFLSKNSVMLHNLATKHKFRNKGIATALTVYMMQFAKKMNFKHCFLDSSDEGFHLYQKIGFKVYGVTSVYELKKTK